MELTDLAGDGDNVVSYTIYLMHEAQLDHVGIASRCTHLHKTSRNPSHVGVLFRAY